MVINATLSTPYNVSIKLNNQPYSVVVMDVDKTLADITGQQLNTNRVNISEQSAIAYWPSNSNEIICNLNYGEVVTISDSVYFGRSDRTHFNSVNGNNTDSPTIASSLTIILPYILNTTDGHWVAVGPHTIHTGGGKAYFVYSTVDTTGYYPRLFTSSQYASDIGFSLDRYTTFDTARITLGATIQGLIIQSDPYADAGDSTTGGGGGSFDGSSDPVPVPSLPSVGACDTGFISLFIPSQAQLQTVANYLWSNLFDVATLKKLFEDPMDCILGLSVVPVTVPTSGNAQITVGNIELSGITLPLASQQYIEVDCGTVDFTDKFFGSYLDQEPYTKMALFVPYSGVHAVSADDIMGKVVGLKYHIDILTGSLVAFLTCGNSVLYEFNGACASNIPVNSLNYASTIENAIRIAVNIGTTVATAGAAAPLTGANIAEREAAKTFGTALNMAGSTAEGALSLKPSIDRAGSLGGTTGLMGNQIPYFIITRPRLCKPANQNTMFGYPSFITTSVSDLIGQGYTAFETILLAGLYLTDSEKNELKQILESGVYL